MKIKAVKTVFGCSCYAIRFRYCNDVKHIKEVSGDSVEILGINQKDWPRGIAIMPEIEIAVVNPTNDNYDYLLLLGNLVKKDEDFETIRRSGKKVIAICDFDFIDDIEQYEAAGAVVLYFNNLRKRNA
jgi:hypothetical protein